MTVLCPLATVDNLCQNIEIWQPPPGVESALTQSSVPYISPEFAPTLDVINNLALQSGVQLQITSSARSTVVAATMSNHLTVSGLALVSTRLNGSCRSWMLPLLA